AVTEFDDKKLNPLENQILDLIGKDGPAAVALYNSAYVAARQEQHTLLERFITSTKEATDALIRTAHTAQIAATWALVALFALAAVSGYYFARALARPLTGITQAANLMAKGELNVELPRLDGGDELSQLVRAFEQLLASLRSFSTAAGRVAAGDLTAEF